MTISNASRTAGPFIGDGVTVAFPFSYKVFSRADVLVARTVTATNVETVLVLDADYIVALNTNQNSNPGGTITLAAALAVGTTLAATSNLPIQQSLDLTNQGGFYPAVINDALDRIVITIQQIAARVGAGALNIGAAATIANILNTLLTLAGATGSSLVGFLQSGLGAVLRTVQDKLRGRVSVFDFMSDAMRADVRAFAYTLDHTAAINAAITAAGSYRGVEFPGGGYKQTAKFIQLAGQHWYGEGGQRATTLRKSFNGDMMDLATLGRLSDLNLDANGASFTGKGIRVPAGFSLKIDRVRVSQSQDNCLYFAPGAGGGTNVNGFEGDTTSPTSVGAIKLDSANSGPVPIFMNGIWLSGGVLDLSAPGAGNGSSMVNFYIRNILTAGPIASGSALFHMANGRVASLADTTTFSGSDFSISNVAFSAPVYLDNAQGMLFATCTFGGGITENPATCNSNKFDSPTLPFTPSWTQNGGTQPAIGNGSLTGFYVRTDGLCSVSMRLVVGSTTTMGNSASAYQFGLPFVSNPSSGFDQRIPNAAVIYSGAGAVDYPASLTIASNTQFVTAGRNGAGVRLGYPATWQTGDTIDMQFEYVVK